MPSDTEAVVGRAGEARRRRESGGERRRGKGARAKKADGIAAYYQLLYRDHRRKLDVVTAFRGDGLRHREEARDGEGAVEEGSGDSPRRDTPKVSPPSSRRGANGLRGGLPKKANSSARLLAGERLSWLSIDYNGQLKTHKASRLEMCQTYDVPLRDMRLLDPELSASNSSGIMCRASTILLNLGELKVIITHKEATFRAATTSRVQDLVHALQHSFSLQPAPPPEERSGGDASRRWQDSLARLKRNKSMVKRNHHKVQRSSRKDAAHGDSSTELSDERASDTESQSASSSDSNRSDADAELTPSTRRMKRRRNRVMRKLSFEFRALEICLEICLQALVEDADALDTYAREAAQAMEKSTTTAGLDQVRIAKTRLTRLSGRVDSVRDAVQALVDNEAQVQMMHITERQRQALQGGEAEEIDVTEAVDLLESYFAMIDGVWDNLQLLGENVSTAEDFVNIKLNAHRNKLEQIELLFVSGTFILALFAVITGTFGMNLASGLESDMNAFHYSVGISTGICVVLYILFIVFCRSIGLLERPASFTQISEDSRERRLTIATTAKRNIQWLKDQARKRAMALNIRGVQPIVNSVKIMYKSVRGRMRRGEGGVCGSFGVRSLRHQETPQSGASSEFSAIEKEGV